MSATTAERPIGRLDVSGTPPVGFGRLVGVELRKMADTRAGFWLLVSMGLLTLAIDIGMLCFAAFKDTAFSMFDFATVPAAVLGILLPVLAIMSVTGERTQRTAMVTYALEPRRVRVIEAKAVAAVAVALAAVVCAVVLGALANLVYTIVSVHAASWNFGAAQLGGFALAMVLGLLTGFAFGTVLGNTAAAIVGYFVYSFVLTGLLSWLAYAWHAFDKVRPWIDFNFSQSPLSTHDMSDLRWGPLVVSGILWLVLPIAFGVWRLLRSEVK